MYKVIRFFHDLQDGVKTKGGEIYHAYNVGDTYPRNGYEPSAERIAELSGNDNKRGLPLIELVEQPAEAPEESDETEENAEAPAPKRRRKTKTV